MTDAADDRYRFRADAEDYPQLDPDALEAARAALADLEAAVVRCGAAFEQAGVLERWQPAVVGGLFPRPALRRSAAQTLEAMAEDLRFCALAWLDKPYRAELER